MAASAIEAQTEEEMNKTDLAEALRLAGAGTTPRNRLRKPSSHSFHARKSQAFKKGTFLNWRRRDICTLR